ncbi:MAG: maleylpyruvate isomerase N-terminal domain-containing protein [Cytophagales bacterium]|nr:maleylpyruvate isomerase N-terminal domain-containing protein [Cytophagales bacterium]
MSKSEIPVDARPLFKPLDHLLIDFLKQLEPTDWNKQTVAKHWKVKDVATHLLDGNLRALSMQRDYYFGENPPEIKGFRDLVEWLNQLNADWVKATKRLSPAVLVMLLELSGEQVSEYYSTLDPWEEAAFSVAWAGEATSYNWMHVAREYTEKWHHQQQIRDAMEDRTILSQQFFQPVINTFMLALPHTFRDVTASDGTIIRVTVDADAGGTWWLKRAADQWELVEQADRFDAAVNVPLDISWKLFTKSLRPSQIQDQVTIEGDQRLAEKVLSMVSVMA